MSATTAYSPEQKTIITSPSTHTKIVAAAGSGKTTTLTGRAKYLLSKERNLHQEDILFLVFNVAACSDIKEKLAKMHMTNIEVKTLDAFCLHIVSKYAPDILDLRDQQEYVYLACQTLARLPEGQVKKYKYIFVDEAQDISQQQFLVINSLYQKTGAIISKIGDNAQTIYEWRDARPEYLLNHDKHYPNVESFEMNDNYRSAKPIISLANEITKQMVHLNRNSEMVAKSNLDGDLPIISAFNTPTEEINYIIAQIGYLHQTKGVPYENMAILTRRNSYIAHVVERAFLLAGLPLYLPRDPTATESFSSVSAKKVGHITCCTIHVSKGLEWDYIFLPNCCDTVIPGKSATSEEGIGAEQNLLYVAVTRAKKGLYISWAIGSVKSKPQKLCRFLRRVPANLYTGSAHQYIGGAQAEDESIPPPYEPQIGGVVELLESLDPPQLEQIYQNFTTSFGPHYRKNYSIKFLHAPLNKEFYDQYVTSQSLQKYFGLLTDLLIKYKSGAAGDDLARPLQYYLRRTLILPAHEYKFYCENERILKEKWSFNAKLNADYVQIIEAHFPESPEVARSVATKMREIINKNCYDAHPRSPYSEKYIEIFSDDFFPSTFFEEIKNIVIPDFWEGNNIFKKIDLLARGLVLYKKPRRPAIIYRKIPFDHPAFVKWCSSLAEFRGAIINKTVHYAPDLDSEHQINGEVDLIQGKNIIDIKISQEDNVFDQIKYLLQVCIYAKMYGEAEEISLYNATFGKYMTCSLKDWKDKDEKLKWLIEFMWKAAAR